MSSSQRPKNTFPRLAAAAALAVSAVVALAGCSREDDMADQPKYIAGRGSDQFADGKADRPLVTGTVPRGGYMNLAESYNYQGNSSVRSPMADQGFPADLDLTAADVERGREQYNIFCTPCHGALGDGNGMIVQRGFPRPPSFYLARLRMAPTGNLKPGHVYDVITNGYGAMFSYNDRVNSDDRWRIAAYIAALQASAPDLNGSETLTATAGRGEIIYGPDKPPAVPQPNATQPTKQAVPGGGGGGGGGNNPPRPPADGGNQGVGGING
ncbi:MAG TPA: cytochrome c [Tepidisphaeraceae bacterium]|nr:cytochrome c [Tepidisphaeraceae bacterium]